MNTYKAFDVRNSVAAVICTALFSATCLVGTVGPARAATPAAPASAAIVMPLA